MKHVVLFSGGTSSAYVAWLVSQEQDKKDIVLLHTPTYTENHDADTFRHEVARYIGLPITEWGYGLDLFELSVQQHTPASPFIPFCTRILKQDMKKEYFKYLKSIGEEFTEYIGYGAEEKRRVDRVLSKNIDHDIRFPVYERQIKSAEIKRIIRDEWGIKLPKAYEQFEHNNCIPCFKSGKASWIKAWKYYPERFYKAAELEAKLGHTVFKGVSLYQLAREWAEDEEAAKMQLSLFDAVECTEV